MEDRVHDEIQQIKQLAARMLVRAFCDYVNNRKWANGRRPKNKRDRRKKGRYEDARLWLFSEQDCNASDDVVVEGNFISLLEAQAFLEASDQTMSFETACGTLGWDPDWVRRMLPTVTPEALRTVSKQLGFV